MSLNLLDTYLGRHTGGRVLEGNIQRGDDDDICVLIWFCDLRKSSTLGQLMEPRDVLGLLNSFYDCLAGAVLDNGGEV
jgi:adenylate cyclase